MNILETEFHQDWGGQPAYMLLLARELQRAGHTVTMAVPPGSELARRGAEADVPVFTDCHFQRGFRPLAFWRDVRALGRCLRERKIDIIHAHGSQDSWLAALANRWFYGKAKIVKTKHNDRPVKTHLANRWLYGSLCTHCTVVAKAIQPLIAPLIPLERISVIHAPVENRFWQHAPAPLDLRAEFGLPDSALLIGQVARLSHMKGQDVVIDAAPEVLKAIPEARFILVGTGEDYHRLLDRIEAAGLTKRVYLAGFREDVLGVLDALDLYILPSIEREGSPISLKEAMARGRAVIATNASGVPEIVADGVTGRLIPVRDPKALAAAIIELIRDKKKAEAMGQAAQARVQAHYTGERTAQAFVAIFERVLAEEPAQKIDACQ